MFALPLHPPTAHQQIASVWRRTLSSSRFWLTLAVLTDLIVFALLVVCALGADQESGYQLQVDAALRTAGRISAMFYIVAASISIGTSLTKGKSIQTDSPGLWLCGLGISIATLPQPGAAGLSPVMPFWGLFPILMATKLLGLADARAFQRMTGFFASCVTLLVIWGQHGDLNWLCWIDIDWQGLDAGAHRANCEWIPGLGWSDVAIALVLGFAAVVFVPCLLARSWMSMGLSELGLGVPAKHRASILVWSVIYLVVGLPVFFFAARDPALQSHYPYVREFGGWSEFVLFECATLLFYAAVEFFFRGYVLFGVERILTTSLTRASRTWISAIAVFASAVPYIIWHLEKPQPELLGALLWSVVAGLSAVWFRSVIHLILVHWIWNVWLDWWVIQDLGLAIG